MAFPRLRVSVVHSSQMQHTEHKAQRKNAAWAFVWRLAFVPPFSGRGIWGLRWWNPQLRFSLLLHVLISPAAMTSSPSTRWWGWVDVASNVNVFLQVLLRYAEIMLSFFQRWTAFNIFCVFKDICFKQAFPHCTAHVDFDFIPQTFGSAPTALTSYSTAYRPNGLCCFRAKRRIQGCCIYYHRDYRDFQRHLSLGVGKKLAL